MSPEHAKAVTPKGTNKKAAKPVVPAPVPLDPVTQEEVESGDLVTDVWLRFGRFGWDALGVGLIAFALITLIGLVNLYTPLGWDQGVLLNLWSTLVSTAFGWGWPIVVLAFLLLGLLCFRRRFASWPTIPLGRVLALEGLAFGVLTLLSISGGMLLHDAEVGNYGGVIGWGLATLLARVMPPPWGTIFVLALMLLFLLYGSGFAGWSLRKLEAWLDEVNPTGAAGVVGPVPAASDENEEPVQPALPGMPLLRSNALPPLTLLLSDQNARPDESVIKETAMKIEHRLEEFGVPAKVTGYRVGPTVTQFAVEPGYVEKPGPDGEIIRQKVRVSQISGLSRDLALALSAERLRIEAPVPGRSYVGIEVPNQKNAIVRLRSIMESDAFTRLTSPLAVALGKDVSGQPLVADLSRMPHLLIAGTTGSGKSICIAALATCLVANNTPEDLRLAMLDPKMVELVRFNGLPHMLGKVETELERMLGVLRWALAEMDHRYKLLENQHARDINTYNRKMEKKNQPRLPRIVIFVDELADLMMTAPDQTEHSIIRLAQMARAVGIHLVVATQRPSTDVVTGLIKANFPARLAFSVASSIDSRVILDVNGAETLLGKGDMLFLNPETGSPLRAQGAMVADDEIDRVQAWWQQKPEYDPSLPQEPAPWEGMVTNPDEEGGDQQLVDQAAKIVRQTQRASTSLLQRRLRVGYPRAARLMDELEDLGVVGPSQGGGREREVLLPPLNDVEEEIDD